LVLQVHALIELGSARSEMLGSMNTILFSCDGGECEIADARFEHS
jgi:hypothetical protein